MSENINSAWKTLRNFLRKMGVVDSLEAIWWYTWSTFPRPPSLALPGIPANMNYHKDVINPDNHFLFAWELKLLASEIILNGQESVPLPQDSLKERKNFHKAMNKLKHVTDVSTEITLENAHVLDELYRIEHQQLRYQGHSRDYVAFIRYFKIFNTETINKILESRLKIDSQRLFTANLYLIGLFLKNPTLKYPIVVSGVSSKISDDVGLITKICASTLSDLRCRICESHKTDDTYAYKYNQLTATPLVICEKMNQQVIVCPVPLDLQMRLLSGLYYDLCDDKKFKDGYEFCKVLGESFENYVGDLIKSTLKEEQVISENESAYNKELNRCDWIIEQERSCLLVECKAKRPIQESYVNVMALEPLATQLNILADAIVQSYMTYHNYSNRIYKNPNHAYDSTKNYSICIVTLENWYLLGKQKEEFDKIVITKLEEAGLSVELIDEVPYVIMSAEEFEEFSYYLKRYDGFDLIRKFNRECPLDTVRSIKNFVDKDFANEYDYTFRNDMPGCFSEEVRAIIKSAWGNRTNM